MFKHIGTASAQTIWTDERGDPKGSYEVFHWLLLVGPFGWRRFKLIGDKNYMSRSASNMHARVVAWTKGGPLPPLDQGTAQPKPAPVLKIVRD